jgi:hypothetical protein
MPLRMGRTSRQPGRCTPRGTIPGVPLVALDIPLGQDRTLPEAAARLIADGNARIEQFIEAHLDDPAAGFVPSDFEQVFRALHAVRLHTPEAVNFCEWGSGMGVITCLAAILGFDAVGIEIDARLVRESRKLARDHRVRAQLVQGSYVPDGHESEEDFDESHVMTLEHGRAAYEELGLDPDDFDIIFAYPWPGEDDVVSAIFRRYAARGAILITFHGQDGVIMRRKK